MVDNSITSSISFSNTSSCRPKVSIVIPAYNASDYIAKAVESALEQTLSDIETIVVDDASTDNTVAIVEAFDDPRLKLIRNEQNLGIQASRNRALMAASGKWVALLDADDWYAPNRLERLVEVAEDREIDMVADDLSLVIGH
jgi:succinoglycan biosynthesis protein ExoO